ncbi:hypothetical protein DFJ74DRAFT_502561 [Hyaloraphidium curvatum]|nr:hypothetical protein DFJ74DRAFT_502561 [Hyaloraphidium curvatum]
MPLCMVLEDMDMQTKGQKMLDDARVVHDNAALLRGDATKRLARSEKALIKAAMIQWGEDLDRKWEQHKTGLIDMMILRDRTLPVPNPLATMIHLVQVCRCDNRASKRNEDDEYRQYSKAYFKIRDKVAADLRRLKDSAKAEYAEQQRERRAAEEAADKAANLRHASALLSESEALRTASGLPRDGTVRDPDGDGAPGAARERSESGGSSAVRNPEILVLVADAQEKLGEIDREDEQVKDRRKRLAEDIEKVKEELKRLRGEDREAEREEEELEKKREEVKIQLARLAKEAE